MCEANPWKMQPDFSLAGTFEHSRSADSILGHALKLIEEDRWTELFDTYEPEQLSILAYGNDLPFKYAEYRGLNPGDFIPNHWTKHLVECAEDGYHDFARWRARRLLDIQPEHECHLEDYGMQCLIKSMLRTGSLTCVERILRKTGLSPRCLELELTENVLMENIKQAQTALNVLGQMGVLVAIDDFGTGYSSLSYLLNLPIDTLKIDKCFIQSIGQQDDGATIATAVIALARSLKLNVVAEGVETSEQQEFLREKGCDFIQGYYFCRPLPAAELVPILSQHAKIPTSRKFNCLAAE